MTLTLDATRAGRALARGGTTRPHEEPSRGLLVLVEALARGDAGLARVDVALQQRDAPRHRGVGVLRRRVHTDDLPGQRQADAVKLAERALHGVGARGERPGEVNGLHVRDAVGHQPHRRLEPRDEQGVQDVARLLLVERQANHANRLGKVLRQLKGLVTRLVLAHELCDVVAPDLVGKVEGHEAVRATGRLRKHARQHRGRVGEKNRPLREVLGELRVERGLLRRVLVDALDHDVGVAEGDVVVHDKANGVEALLGLRLELVDLLGGEVALVGEPAAVRLGVARLHLLERVEVLAAHHLKARHRAGDGLLAAHPHRDVVAFVGNLRRDLATLRTATSHRNVAHLVDLHGSTPFIGNRPRGSVLQSFDQFWPPWADGPSSRLTARGGAVMSINGR